MKTITRNWTEKPHWVGTENETKSEIWDGQTLESNNLLNPINNAVRRK